MTGTALDMVTPEEGERVYSRCHDGWWRWGVVTKKYWKKDEALYYSILYDDGYFVEDFEAANGIATLAQYNAGHDVSPGDANEMNPHSVEYDNQMTPTAAAAAAGTDISAELMTNVKQEDQTFEHSMSSIVPETSDANSEGKDRSTEAPLLDSSRSASNVTLPFRKRKHDKAIEEEYPNEVLLAGKCSASGQNIEQGSRGSETHTPTVVDNENLDAISLLEACESEYFVRNPAATKFPRLVLDEDRHMVSDYFYYSFKQMRCCLFTESDKCGRRQAVWKMLGLECIHCADAKGGGKKFFSSTTNSLKCNSNNIVGHVMNCKWCPQQIKRALLQLRRCNLQQSVCLSRGSKKAFFERIWRRMGDNDSAAALADGDPACAAPSMAPNTRLKAPSKQSIESESQREHHASSPSDAAVRVATESNMSTATKQSSRLNQKMSADTSSAGSKDYDSAGEDSLLLFLQRQKLCLKVPPEKFHEFLISQDILTVVDLADSFEDEDYHSTLQSNGLKGFKFGRFLAEAKKAANSENESGK